MTSVSSQVVFITGGGHGIGAEVARRLHAKGAKLVLTDLDEAALAERSAELGGDEHVLTVVADVRDLAAMQAAAAKAVETFGGIDAVVANAGIASYGSVLHVDPEAVKRVLDVNLLGVFHTVRATLPVDHRAPRLRPDRLVAGRVRGGAGNGALRHVQGRQRASCATRCGSRSPTSASPSARRTCPGSTPRWFATPRTTCRSFREQLAKFPWPLNKTTSVDKCAAAFVDGIEDRRKRVYCPGWVGLFRWLKPFLSTRFGEGPLLKTAGGLVPQMDAEVAALGRSTSAHTQQLEKS